MHTHHFLARWLCEHILTDDRVRHAQRCPRGRYVYVCECGEVGYGI